MVNMKEILLTQGLVAMVDNEDYDRITKYKWYANKSCLTYYALRKITVNGKRVAILMHREILQAAHGELTDHKDGNGLNNQKDNLRICNGSQNCRNARKSARQYTSIFKGVHRRKRIKNPWVASIRMDGRLKHLGVFSNEETAARTYDEAALRLFGEYARLNFRKE